LAAIELQESPDSRAAKCATFPADLAKIVAARPTLPEPLKRAMMALISSPLAPSS
jgi:hypothetical protein